MTTKYQCAVTSFVVILATLSGGAYGQQVSSAATGTTAEPSATAPDNSGGLLEEVVVNARKTSESAQSIPIAITALSDADLEKSVVLNVEDLSNHVTGLSVFPNSKGSSPNFSIRVARTSGQAGGGISTYFDDVPVNSSYSALNAFYDVGSVSVLKGPQGTLFGVNSTGGAIIFHPNTPTDNFEGYVDLGVGNYSRHTGELMVNIPINDVLQVRVAGQIVRRDGYVTNLTPVNGNDQLSGDKHESLRATVRFKPNDQFTNDLIWDYYDENDQPRQEIPVAFANPYLTAPIANTTGCGVLCGPFGLTPTGAGIRLYNYRTVSLGDNASEPDSNTPTFNKVYIWGLTDVANFNLNDNFSIKNVLAYRHEHLDSYEDSDGTSLPLVNGRSLQTNKQITEEPSIHLQTTDGKLKYVGGLFISSRTLDYSDIYNLAFLIGPTFIPALPAPGAGLFGFPEITTDDYFRTFKSYAAYSQVSYDVTSDITATFGLRYTVDKGNYMNHLRGGSGNGDTALGLGPAFLDAGGVPSVGPCRTVSQSSYPNYNLAECSGSNSHTWQDPSFNFSLDGKIAQNSLLYATARGSYQSGGFNDEIANVSLQTFAPERAVDFEVGTKTDWALLGRPVRTNFDVFYGHYKNMQRTQNGSYTSGGQFQGVFNAGSATYYGADLEITFFPIRDLELDLAYTYINAYYDSFTIPAIPGAAGSFATKQDLSGSPIGYTPEDTLTMQATYHWPLPESVGAVSTTVSGYYRSSTSFSDVPTPGFTQFDSFGRYEVFNLNQDWLNIFGSHADLILWGKNLTNREYAVNSSNQMLTFGYATYTYGDPRTFGLNVRYKF